MRKLLAVLIFSSLLMAGNIDVDKNWEELWWQQNNPNIYRNMWDPVSMHPTLDSLKLDNLTYLNMDSDTAKKITAAKNELVLAEIYKKKCKEEMDYAISLNCQAHCAAGVILPLVSILAVPCVVDCLNTLTVFEHMNSYITVHTEYGVHWKKTMSQSADALAKSAENMEDVKEELELEYTKIEKMGLCDDDYFGPGRTECNKVKAAIESINKESTEGTYGQYNQVIGYTENLNKQSEKSAPDFSNYSIAMYTIWNEHGAMKTIGNLTELANKSRYDATQYYTKIEMNASFDKEYIEKISKMIESENLQKITEAKSTHGKPSDLEKGTIAERYIQLKAIELNASLYYKNGKTSEKTKEVDRYLKDAIKNIESAGTYYKLLKNEYPKLESDAKIIVTTEMNDAKKAIANARLTANKTTITAIVKEYLDEAENNYKKGEISQNLGDKYENYAMATKNANIAKTLANGQKFNESAEITALKKDVKNLLDNCKKDGVPTASEEAMYGYFEKSDSADAKENLEGIRKSLLNKITVMYAYLEDQRGELLQKIYLIGGNADDQKTIMEIAEKGLVLANGSIDYEKAAGKLKLLEGTYSEVDLILDGYTKEMVAGSIKKDITSIMDPVELDTPTNMTVYVTLTNTKQYNASNVGININMPIEATWMYSDMVYGNGNVLSVHMSDQTTTTVILREIKPFEQIKIIFSKRAVLASIDSETSSIKGLGDGSARIDTKINFHADSDLAGFLPPKEMENFKVDGIANKQKVAKGKHVLSSSYLVNDAYNISFGNQKSSIIGLNSKIEYDIILTPRMDIDKTVVFVDTPFDARISNLKLYSLTGEKISPLKTIISGTRYYTEVSDMETGKITRLHVSYDIQNTTDYINSRITVLKNENYSKTIADKISDLETNMKNENNTDGIKELQEIETLIKNEAAEKEKYRKKTQTLKNELNLELMDIKNALKKAAETNLSGEFVGKLTARKNELETKINKSDGMSDNESVALLELIDTGWAGKELTKIRKELANSYDKLKARFVSAGNLSTPNEFLDFEKDLHMLEASNDLIYATNALASIEKIGKLVSEQEGKNDIITNSLKNDYLQFKTNAEDLINKYTQQQSSAKGSNYAQYFTLDGSKLKTDLEYIGALLSKNKIDDVKIRINSINRTLGIIDAALKTLESETKTKIIFAEDLYGKQKNGISSNEQSIIDGRIKNIKLLASSGKYIDALKETEGLIKKLTGTDTGSSGNTLLILGITAIAILATIIVYLFRKNDLKLPFKKHEKTYKKLDKAE